MLRLTPHLFHFTRRSLRTFLASVVASQLIIVAVASTFAATPTPEAALKLKPVQSDAEFETVSPENIEGCKVVDINEDKVSGWEVIGPNGLMLRRFVDTNEDKKIDLWCYYQYGVETYRDVDQNFNGKADQYRWLGTSGSRWGLDDDEDGVIDRWQRISAEEVSFEVIEALRKQDVSRFERLLISGSELKNLGLGKEKAESLTSKSNRAAKEFDSLASRQKAVTKDSAWLQFASSTPGIIPAGTDGSSSDVVVYENAVAMYESADKSGQLVVGTMIQVGDTWRLVDLPQITESGEPVAQAVGNFFTPGSGNSQNVAANANMSGQEQELVTELESIDRRLTETKIEKDIAALHARRASIVEKLVKNAADPEERATWARQLIDTVSVAVQSGAYPDGLENLKSISQTLVRGDKPLMAYADYQTLATEYVIRQSAGDADFVKVQAWYVESLNDFVERYADTPEAGQAMMQLALSKEFEGKEAEALKLYSQVAEKFRATDAGEKAAGAARRLDSVGRPIELQGKTLDGKMLQVAKLKGRPVVIHYWATWCEPCKQDMKLLRRLQSRYAKAGLQIVGVNVDATEQQALSYLKENPLPWPQLFAPGGLEASELAKQYGVQTLPTILLVDKAGKVAKHNVRSADLDGEIGTIAEAK